MRSNTRVAQKRSNNIQQISMCSLLCEKSSAGWMGGWMNEWMEVKAGLRIAYSNQKSKLQGA